MDIKLEQWANEYNLKELNLVGYRGGYPIIQFMKTSDMEIFKQPQKKLDKIVRKSEMSAGFEMGVGVNFRRTAGIIVNDETIVIYGHETILERILDKLF